MDLLFLAKCHENDFFPAKRALNREIYRMFTELEISIPYDQIVVNQPIPEGQFPKSDLTEEDRREASRFAYQQASLSKDAEKENDS